MRCDLGGDSLYIRAPDSHLIELGAPGIWRTFLSKNHNERTAP